MDRISVYLNQEKGIAAHFGKEEQKIREVLDSLKDEDNPTLYIASPTQLLCLQLLCQKRNIELAVFDEDGKRFESIIDAHRYIDHEYIELDLFGLKGE